MISYCINHLLSCINGITRISFLIITYHLYIVIIVQAYNPVMLSGISDVKIVYIKLVVVSLIRPKHKLVIYIHHNVL